MNKIFKGLLLTSIVLTVGCDKFDDININPNEPTFVGSETLLTSAQRSVGSVVGSAVPVLYVQHMSDITYTESSRYGSSRGDFNGFYTGPLANLQKIISLNSDEATKGDVLSGGSNSNQIGVARIMKAYFMNHLVERWGPVPYSTALQGNENLLPKYDDEAAIYADLFKELKEGAAMLDGATIKGDILLGGDTNRWKEFSNALRAVIALRLADVDPSTAQSEFTSAVNSGIGTGSYMYDYLGEAANENPWFARFRTRTDYAISDVFVDYLTSTADPRISSFADPAASTGTIVGMPYGLENSDWMPTDVSFPHSTYVKAQDVDIPIISEAQMHFMLAEAAARGWTSDDAVAHYENGIRASMLQWDITDESAIEAFLQGSDVQYDASNWKKSIGMQKWVALYGQGYEAWAEWRRLDYPQLTPAEAPLNPSEDIPVRFMYPETENTLNGANLQAAISMLGGDDNDGVKLYWDVN